MKLHNNIFREEIQKFNGFHVAIDIDKPVAKESVLLASSTCLHSHNYGLKISLFIFCPSRLGRYGTSLVPYYNLQTRTLVLEAVMTVMVRGWDQTEIKSGENW